MNFEGIDWTQYEYLEDEIENSGYMRGYKDDIGNAVEGFWDMTIKEQERILEEVLSFTPEETYYISKFILA